MQNFDEWRHQQKLTRDGGGPQENQGDGFGMASSLSGDGTTAIIGAPYEDSNGRPTDSAYVFTQSGGEWRQQQKLTPKDGDAGNNFGESVSMSGDGATAIIGAEWDQHGRKSGSAYVFTQSDGEWRQQQKLIPNDVGVSHFGVTVSISDDGTTAIIGTKQDSGTKGRESGSTYVFTQSGDEWRQQQKLTPTDGAYDRIWLE